MADFYSDVRSLGSQKTEAHHLGEVTIGSGSMSHTIHPLTAERFSSSLTLSCRSAPNSSERAFSLEKTFGASMGRCAETKYFR